MINSNYLFFSVLTKPDLDLFTKVQSNAKFKSLTDVVRTKVGINNFYNFSIQLKSSILFRDVVLNSQFVSGWARSSQVLNDNDSKFSVYKFLTKNKTETDDWIKTLENLEANGHSMDNMRALITLDSISDYAISIDILHLLYLTLVLDEIVKTCNISDFIDECNWFVNNFKALLNDYGINIDDFKSQMLQEAFREFPVIGSNYSIKPNKITLEYQYEVNATYSVIGQMWRHRTLIKQYNSSTYQELLVSSKELTKNYDFSQIGMNEAIAKLVVDQTENAKSVYDLCQGSIVPFVFSGTTAAIHKALSQRTCFINDSPQFKDAFEQWTNNHPELPLLPPCKLNMTSSNNCYVGYVNESRMRGEEKTQVVCPIYACSHGRISEYNEAIKSNKAKWYIENIKHWNKVAEYGK